MHYITDHLTNSVFPCDCCISKITLTPQEFVHIIKDEMYVSYISNLDIVYALNSKYNINLPNINIPSSTPDPRTGDYLICVTVDNLPSKPNPTEIDLAHFTFSSYHIY